jgi:hypothetical protein
VILPKILFNALCFYWVSHMLLAKVVYNTWSLRWWNIAFVPEV